MAMACNHCRAELSGNYPCHLVRGLIYCDLCFDRMLAVASNRWLMAAHIEHIRERARRWIALHGG